MSNRKASYRHKVLLGGNPVGVLTTVGRTVKEAQAVGAKILRSHGARQHGERNPGAGFYDGQGRFHSARPAKVKPFSASKKKRNKKKRSAKKNTVKKRKPLSFGQRMAKLRAKKKKKNTRKESRRK